MKLNKKDVEKLADGLNPKYVNPKWDYETVIVELAKAWLKHFDDEEN